MLRIILIVFALVCAGAMSQFPEFFQQYKQRMGGALDEVNRQVEALDARAAEINLDRFDYIRRFLNSTDSVIQGEGDAMVAVLVRQTRYAKILARFEAAPWYMQAAELVFHFETDIAENALKEFVPAVPLSLSGGAHALFGFLFGYLLPLCLRAFFPRRAPQMA